MYFFSYKTTYFPFQNLSQVCKSVLCNSATEWIFFSSKTFSRQRPSYKWGLSFPVFTFHLHSKEPPLYYDKHSYHCCWRCGKGLDYLSPSNPLEGQGLCMLCLSASSDWRMQHHLVLYRLWWCNCNK